MSRIDSCFFQKSIDKKFFHVIITSKGGDNRLNITRVYLLISVAILIFSIIFKILLLHFNQSTIFFYSLFFHLISALYICYSLFEIFVLHEKQGSKLTLSKEKFHSDWR